MQSLPGDRALVDVLRAEGLIQNGGILNAIEILSSTELSNSVAGFLYFDLDAVVALLERAKRIQDDGVNLERFEQQLDGEYAALVNDPLWERFELRLNSHPNDFEPLRQCD